MNDKCNVVDSVSIMAKQSHDINCLQTLVSNITACQYIEIKNLNTLLERSLIDTSSFNPSLIAITVSVNYHETLQIALKRNHNNFKVWYIVTDVADTTTFEICKQYTNVVVLFFNFKSNNAVFNKGGAVRMAQQFVHKLHKNDYILILDSDIILPSDFQDVIYDLTPLHSDILYGCRRLVFKTIQDFNLNLKVPIAVEPVCIGFFQLYKTHQLYENSIDCSECDMHFIQKFKGVIVIPNTLVAHLGETGVNWQGRKT